MGEVTGNDKEQTEKIEEILLKENMIEIETFVQVCRWCLYAHCTFGYGPVDIMNMKAQKVMMEI